VGTMAFQIKRIEELRTVLTRLSRREKFMVGGLALAFTLFFGVVLSMWISSKLSSIEHRISEGTNQLQTIINMRQQFEEAKETQKRSLELMRRGKAIQLFGILETLAKQQGVNIGQMKRLPPTVEAEIKTMEDKVEVNIPLITIDRLVGFLEELEKKSETIKVRALNVKQNFREPTQLDVQLTVSNFQEMEEKENAASSEKKEGTGAAKQPKPPVEPPSEK
jgi:hypothetical protein